MRSLSDGKIVMVGMTTLKNALAVMVLLGALAMQGRPLSAAEISVMSGGAPQEALAVLTPQFEKQTGHTVKYSFAVITALKQRLDAGEKADMVLLPVPVIEAYVKAGKMRTDGWAALGNIGVIVIVKQGAPLPDI